MKNDHINNTFCATSDSFPIASIDTIRTKIILIDSDPANTSFLDSLRHDIIKAIAWVEYAGSNDVAHCHNPYNPRYNNYWDIRISGSDTCPDTRMPCENRLSTATGTMQMMRTTWEKAFEKPDYEPSGYFRAHWDSLAWSWKINIVNGKFIYFTDNFYHINKSTNPQRNWDSLYLPQTDYTPDSTNKEDISVYGYYVGATRMKKINTQQLWDDSVKTNFYVINVRRFKDTKPWQD